MSRNKQVKRRANGEGSLLLRGGTWYAVWYVNGERHVRTTKCTVKRDALKKLEEFTRPTQAKSDIEKLEAIKARIEDIRSGNVDVGKSAPTKIIFMLDAYERDLSRKAPLSERSKEIYQSVIDKLKDFAKSKNKEYVHELTRDDAEEYFTKLSSEVKAVTYNLHLRVLKSLIRVVMKKDNNIRECVFASIPSKLVDKSHHRRELTDEEIDKIISCAEKISHETKVWFMLGAMCGLRRNDAAKLKWKDVSIQDKMIRTLPVKTKRSGIVARIPICKSLLDELQKLDKDGEYVIPSIANLSISRIGEIVRKVFTNAGVKIVSEDSNGEKYFETGFHSFRHSLASRLAREGVPINQIQMILAHSKADMSLYYSHANESDLHIPDKDDETISVRISKVLFKEVTDKKVTIEDALRQWLKGEMSKVISEIQASKVKEKQELDDLIDEVMTQN